MEIGESVIGKIHSIACKNFVTYDDTVIYPGEYLNLIIGPNGTGKSTLAAAIVLGLGGAPKLLSRSHQIENYIKNGKEAAWMEIKIYKNEARETMAFERSFNQAKANTYQIDGTIVNEKAFKKKIKEFGIQIDNLCQFLPQDRVQDFAKINPHEVLINTLNSVCKPHVVENFKKLKDFRCNQTLLKSCINEKYQQLREVEKRIAESEQIVELMKTRSGYMKQVDIGQKKELWLQAKELETEISTTKQELKEAKEIHTRKERAYKKVKQEGANVLRKLNQIEEEKKSEEAASRTLSDTLNSLSDECGCLENAIQAAKSNLDSKKKENEEQSIEINRLVNYMQAAVQDINDFQAEHGSNVEIEKKIKDIDQKLEEIKERLRAKDEQRRGFSRRIENIIPELNAKKKEIDSVAIISERRLSIIRDRFEDVYKAIMWFRNNRGMFKNQIFEPMLLELQVENSENSKYIENTVQLRDLLAFTCVDKTDMNLLVHNLCNEQRLKISVLHSDSADVCSFRPNESIDNYRQYGFHSYLLDMVKGPAPILNYLCQVYHIQNILIGDERVNQYSEQLPKRIRRFYTPTYKYVITTSNYSNDTSSLRENLMSKNLLCASIDQKKLRILRNELANIMQMSDSYKNKRKEIEDRMEQIDREYKTVRNEKKSFEEKLTQLTEFHLRLQSAKATIKRLTDMQINVEEEELKFKQLAKEKVKEILQVQAKRIDCLEAYQKSCQKCEYLKLKCMVFKKENMNLEQRITEAKRALQNALGLVENIQLQLGNIEKERQKLINQVKEVCSGCTPDSQNFPFTRDFSKLPNDLDRLKEHIRDLQTKLEVMTKDNPKALEEYQKNKQLLEKLKKEIEKDTRDSEKEDAQISALHSKWYPEVEEVVNQINSNFSQFMAMMSYVGEVKLTRKEEHDYNSYGISIMVQYREKAKLQLLDRCYQSGGERAVAIAVYSLSLQHITNVPFRLVDEINQGMDPKNERKVFEMLVSQTTKRGTSQYFFITPKLLPNLTYNNFMTVHIVFNGKYVDNKAVFNESSKYKQ